MNSSKMFESIEEKVGLIGQKVGNQKHLSAIRDAFASLIPFIILGAFAILINSVVVSPNSLLATWTHQNDSVAWAAFALIVSPLLWGIAFATMAFAAVYISFLFGYFLSGSYGDNKVAGAGIGLACFLVLQPIAAGIFSSTSGNPFVFFGSAGILFAMIGGLGGPTVFHYLSANEKFSIHMPDGVPPAIASSFKALFPIVFTILLFGLIQPVWGLFSLIVGFGRIQIEGNIGFDVTVKFDYIIEDTDGVLASEEYTFHINQGDPFYLVVPLYNNYFCGVDLTGDLSGNEILEKTIGEILGEWFTPSIDLPKLDIFQIPLGLFFQNYAIAKLGEINSSWENIPSITLADTTSIFNSENFGNYEYSYVEGEGEGGTLSILQRPDITFINGDWYFVINAVNTILVLPVQNAADTAGFVFILMFLIGFFWFFGVHGNNVLMPVISVLWTTASLHNMEVFTAYGMDIDLAIASGQLITFTEQTLNSFLMMGGTGATIALLTAIFIFSKSPQHRIIAKVSTPSGIFQINEPVLFGLPIVLNPFWAIPFMFVMPCSGVFIYFITEIGWLNPTIMMIPWTTPIFISGFLATQDWRSFIWTGVIFAFVFFSYLPFVLLDVRNQAKAELNSGNFEEYNEIKSKIDKLNLKINGTKNKNSKQKEDSDENGKNHIEENHNDQDETSIKEDHNNQDENDIDQDHIIQDENDIKEDHIEQDENHIKEDKNKLKLLILEKKNIENRYIDFMRIQIYLNKDAKNYEYAKELIDKKFALILENKLNNNRKLVKENKEEIKNINVNLKFTINEQKFLNKASRVNEILTNLMIAKERKNNSKIEQLQNKINLKKEKDDTLKKIEILNNKIENLKNKFAAYKEEKELKTKLKYDKLIKKANQVIIEKEAVLLEQNR